ncbi:MAG: GNAT family N-acetyltransferase [Dialister sp.]|nr:GNAT family N-acetyltransferase [Dialister sp.]
MKIRKALKSDEKDLMGLWAYCFEKPENPFFQWYFRDVYRPEEVLLGEVDGHIACDLHRRPYRVSVRGRAFETDYIVGVATHPAARGRGYGKELLRGAFHMAQREGKAFDILMPSSASFYYPLGFSFYAYQWKRRATPEELRRLSEKPFSAGMVNGPEDWKPLAAIYEAYTRERSGYALRDKKFWKRLISGVRQEGYIALVSDETGPAGYMMYSLSGSHMLISEMAFTSPRGRRGLYAFMAGHQGSVADCTWYEPLSDHSFMNWNDGAEHTYIENKSFPFMMGRLLDPICAFDGLPAKAEGETLCFQLIDSFLPDNNGVYVLAADSGHIHAYKTDVFYSLKLSIEEKSGLTMGGAVPDPAFALNAGALAELFFGASTAKDLDREDRLRWIGKPDKNEILAKTDALLPRQATWNMEWY